MGTIGTGALPRLTAGHLRVEGERFPYGLLWRPAPRTGLVVEVLPTAEFPFLQPRRHDLHPAVVRRLFDAVPKPLEQLDPVSSVLWAVDLPVRGLPFVAPCIAAWWRVRDASASTQHPPEALAGAIAVIVGRRSGVKLQAAEAAEAHGISISTLREAVSELEKVLAAVRP